MVFFFLERFVFSERNQFILLSPSGIRGNKDSRVSLCDFYLLCTLC